MESRAHQQGNPWVRGKVRKEKYIVVKGRNWKILGGVKLVHQEGFEDQQSWANPERKRKSLGLSCSWKSWWILHEFSSLTHF